jgi:uncharacterized membrane protein
MLASVLMAAAGYVWYESGRTVRRPDGETLPLSTRLPLIVLAGLWTTVWTLLSLVEITRYIHDPAMSWLQPFAIAAISTATMAIWLTFDLRSARYLRPPLDPPRAWFIHHLRRLPALAIGYFVIVFGLRHLVFALAGVEYWHLPWAALVPYEFVKVGLFYGLWLWLVFGTLTLASWREQSAQLAFTQKALAEAQLVQLQSQLRPHFLFNTLNTISALMQSDVARADRVLTRLGDLLRASLAEGAHETVPLREEVRLLELYAEIMVERFAGRVEVDWQIAPDALPIPVPAMLLQPLLENAFKHGVERTTVPVSIQVIATRDAGRLRLAIRNTGATLNPGWREGIGIANCRERLRVLYGGAANMELTSDPPLGVVARISLPAREPPP